MSAPQLPLEIVQKIYTNIGEDPSTRRKAATLGRTWLLFQRLTCLVKLLFHSKEDVTAFLGLISSPACTFHREPKSPYRIACEVVCLYGTSAEVAGALAPHITPPNALTIGTSAGKAPEEVARAMKSWAGSIRKLTISGGTHKPGAVFKILSSIPKLQELVFQNVSLETIEPQRWRMRPTYAFPVTLRTLSVIGDASLVPLLVEYVIPSGGFRHITTLSVETRFSLQDTGVMGMFDALRTLETIATLKLTPAYEPNCITLEGGMNRIFWSAERPLLRIRGLKSLEIDFSACPAIWAISCLTNCALFLPRRSPAKFSALNIDICVPRRLDLWGEEGPSAQLEQLLDEVDHPNPLSNGPSDSTLVIRNFPHPPGEFREPLTVCGFPVTFVDAGI